MWWILWCACASYIPHHHDAHKNAHQSIRYRDQPPPPPPRGGSGYGMREGPPPSEGPDGEEGPPRERRDWGPREGSYRPPAVREGRDWDYEGPPRDGPPRPHERYVCCFVWGTRMCVLLVVVMWLPVCIRACVTYVQLIHTQHNTNIHHNITHITHTTPIQKQWVRPPWFPQPTRTPTPTTPPCGNGPCD